MLLPWLPTPSGSCEGLGTYDQPWPPRARDSVADDHPTAPRGSPLCVRAVHVASGVRDLAARRPVRLGLAAAVEGWPAWPAALRIFHGPYRFRGSAQLGVSDQDQIYGCSDSPDSVGASVFRQRGCRSDRCNRSRRSCYRHRRSRRTDTRCGYRSGRCNRRKHRLHTSPNSCGIGR